MCVCVGGGGGGGDHNHNKNLDLSPSGDEHLARVYAQRTVLPSDGYS